MTSLVAKYNALLLVVVSSTALPQSYLAFTALNQPFISGYKASIEHLAGIILVHFNIEKMFIGGLPFAFIYFRIR